MSDLNLTWQVNSQVKNILPKSFQCNLRISKNFVNLPSFSHFSGVLNNDAGRSSTPGDLCLKLDQLKGMLCAFFSRFNPKIAKTNICLQFLVEFRTG